MNPNEIYMINEVAIPGSPVDQSAIAICSKCGKPVDKCECKKNK